MTLFDAEEVPPPRAATRLPKADARPVWTRYAAKAPRRCAECEEVAFETSPAPMLPIRQARFSRRHAGATRLYCHAHMRAQREQDDEDHEVKEAS